MTCSKCGTGNAISARFCMQCGAPLVLGAAGGGAPNGLQRALSISGEVPEYAGFWIRVVAVLIDTIVIAIAQKPFDSALGLFIPAPPGLEPEADFGRMLEWLSDSAPFFAAGTALGMILGFLYYGFLESSSKQGSLGKIALGLKVTDLEGRRITFSKAAARYVASILSGALFCLGYLMGAFTKKKQTLHDLIVGTVVVKGK